jgi:hypothetical protein
MTDGPTLVQFPVSTPLTDIPAKLRDLAAAVEAGTYGEVSAVAVVMAHNGSIPVEVFGYGDADPMRALALLHIGIHRMGDMLLVGSIARGK